MATRLLLEGPDLEALLDQVRTEHGSNARIVSADRLRKGGLGGFFSKQWFELGVELSDTPEPEAAPASPAPDSVEALLSLVDLVDLADARDDRSVTTPSDPAEADAAGDLSEQPVLPDLADLPRCTATVIPAPSPTFQDVLAAVDAPTAEPPTPRPSHPRPSNPQPSTPQPVQAAEETPAVSVPAPARPAAAYAAWTPEALTAPEPAPAEPVADTSTAPGPTTTTAPAPAPTQATPKELAPAAPAPTTSKELVPAASTAPAPVPVTAPVDPLAARAKAAARVKAAARAKAAAMGTLPTPAAAPVARTTNRKPATRRPAARPTTATTVALRHEPAPRTHAQVGAEELLVGLPGRVFVVAGALANAIRVAESVAARLRLAPSSIRVAGPAETGHARRIYGPEHAATLAAELKSGGPVVVAADAPVDLPDGGRWAGAIADALGADVLLAVVDGTRRAEDLRRHLDDLGQVSAVAVQGTTTADQAAELGLPTLSIA